MGLIGISLKTGVKKFDELVLKEVKQIISVIKTLKFHLFLFERFIDLQSVPPKNNQKLKNETFTSEVQVNMISNYQTVYQKDKENRKNYSIKKAIE